MREPRSALVRRLTITGASALALMGTLAGAGSVAVVAPACDTHQCDPSDGVWGLEPGQGELIDSTHWESAPITGPWIDYKGQEALVLHFEKFFPNCIAEPPQIYFSPDQEPSEAGASGNYALVSGDIGETISVFTPGQVTIFNNSCAEYYTYVVVWCPDRSDAGAASTEPEAGPATRDGAVEASQ